VTAKGTLDDDAIVRGATGTDITYDTRGERATTQTGSDDMLTMTYTADGYLASVTQDSNVIVKEYRDALGRLTTHEEDIGGSSTNVTERTYDKTGQVTSDTTTTIYDLAGTPKTVKTTTTYSYVDGSSHYQGALYSANAVNQHWTGSAWA